MKTRTRRRQWLDRLDKFRASRPERSGIALISAWQSLEAGQIVKVDFEHETRQRDEFEQGGQHRVGRQLELWRVAVGFVDVDGCTQITASTKCTVERRVKVKLDVAEKSARETEST